MTLLRPCGAFMIWFVDEYKDDINESRGGQTVILWNIKFYCSRRAHNSPEQRNDVYMERDGLYRPEQHTEREYDRRAQCDTKDWNERSIVSGCFSQKFIDYERIED
jgi:hypothetical protein